MNSSVPRVIIHADSFGRHPSFNEGVERAHRYGLVTSAGLAAVGDALEDAVRRVRRLSALDLGLHFLLLDNAGKSGSLKRLAAAWARGELSSREIAGRLRSQLDLLNRVHRLSLSHIILDPGLHVFPPLMRVVSAVAMEYDIPSVRFGSECRPALRLASRAARRFVAAYQRRVPDRCWDRQGLLTPMSLMDMLHQAQPGITEIACRPGSVNHVIIGAAREDGEWERDLQAVCDEAARAAVRFGRVSPATWRDV